MRTNTCPVITKSGNRCKNAAGNLVLPNGKQVCTTHLKMWKKDEDSVVFVQENIQQQVIETLDPESSVRERMPQAMRDHGAVNVNQIRNTINPGPITEAYLNKENHTMTITDPTDEEIIAEMEEDFANLQAEFNAIKDDPSKIDEAAELYSDLVEAQRDLNYEINQASANYSPEKAFVIAGTGTRSIWGDKETMRSIHAHLVTLIKGAIEKHGKVIVIAGGAKGFDYVLAKAAIDAGAELHLYIPSPSYVDYYWGKAGQERNWINKIVESADFVKTVCDHHQYGKANFVRNEAMIDEADIVWAYPDPANTTGKGGTHSAMRYAKKKAVRIHKVTL